MEFEEHVSGFLTSFLLELQSGWRLEASYSDGMLHRILCTRDTAVLDLGWEGLEIR